MRTNTRMSCVFTTYIELRQALFNVLQRLFNAVTNIVRVLEELERLSALLVIDGCTRHVLWNNRKSYWNVDEQGTMWCVKGIKVISKSEVI